MRLSGLFDLRRFRDSEPPFSLQVFDTIFDQIFQMKLLEGKVAIITGASRGIGKGIAETFAANGADLAFTYLSSDEKAKALADELSKNGTKVLPVKSNTGVISASV